MADEAVPGLAVENDLFPARGIATLPAERLGDRIANDAKRLKRSLRANRSASRGKRGRNGHRQRASHDHGC
jgi:hypothetical protein